MTADKDIRCAPDDTVGLRQEIERRDRIIDALVYQVEHNLHGEDRDFALLQTTFMLEAQIRQRTEALTTALDTLSEATAQATTAREQLEAAVDNISDGFALFDPEGRILLCNEAFRRLWGLNGQIAGQLFTALLERSLKTTPDDPVLTHLAADRPGRDRFELTLPSGLALQIRERRMEDGCLVGVYADVTALKAGEARLRQRELARKSQLLQATLDTIDQGIGVFDADGRLVAWNLRFFQLLHLPPPMTTAATLDDVVTHSVAAARLCAPSPAGNLRIEHATAVGETLELARYPMPDGGCVLTVADITSLKTGEARIRHLLQRQRAIFDNANVGIAYVRDRQMVDVNNHMASIFGYDTPTALIGRSTEILYPSHADFEDVGARLYDDLASGGCSERYTRLVRKDGRSLWVQLSGRPLDIREPHEGSIWVFSDVTAEKEQQAQLELSQLVFNHISEALMVIDANNRIESINTAFTATTGYGPDESIGQAPAILTCGTHEPAFYASIQAALDAHDH
ncbi:MAG TPA: PAS-domain containing protein, partial [Pseudomonadales bacterium]|nr:PAS-domain containing protein [Pseudomonadales bacterium]